MRSRNGSAVMNRLWRISVSVVDGENIVGAVHALHSFKDSVTCDEPIGAEVLQY